MWHGLWCAVGSVELPPSKADVRAGAARTKPPTPAPAVINLISSKTSQPHPTCAISASVQSKQRDLPVREKKERIISFAVNESDYVALLQHVANEDDSVSRHGRKALKQYLSLLRRKDKR
jgi:hypothetical protein